MRQVQTTVTVLDDFGSAGDADTVRFSIEGTDYEIDLNKRNRETFLRHLSRWTSVARDVTVSNREAEKADKAAARQWAIDAGLFKAGQRGMFPKALFEQWKQAQS